MTKTYSEIVDDIVAYYKTNPRGLDEKIKCCTYTGCAIGYACGFQVDEWNDLGSIWGVINAVGEESVWEKFLPEYRKTNVDFWRDVQMLHDTSENWVENDLGGQDLTDRGKSYVDSIKAKYRDD